MALDPTRTVAELKALRELTGDDDGAQRVAWTERPSTTAHLKRTTRTAGVRLHDSCTQ